MNLKKIVYYSLALLLFVNLLSFIFTLVMKDNLNILEIIIYIKLLVIGINILLFVIFLFSKLTNEMSLITKIIIGIVIIYNLINSILLIKKIKDIENSNKENNEDSLYLYALLDIIFIIVSLPLSNWLFMNNLL
jgi:hypothetical protein